MAGILIIAGNGFLGRAVRDVLGRQGLPVVATARHDPTCERCDILDADGVGAIIEKVRPEGIVQCAGVTDATVAEAFYRVHVQGTLHVLEAVRRFVPAAPVVLIGSAAEYGPVDPELFPVTEGHAARPVTFYGASKLAQTQLGEVANASWGLKVRTARLFNVIGPGLPGQYFLASIAQRLRSLPRGSPFPVHNLDATRDFVDVRDAAAAVVGLLRPSVPSAVFNVASGLETPLGEVATYLGELAGGGTPFEAGGAEWRVNTSRSRGDAARLRAETGWVPRSGWRESVADFWHGFVRRGEEG